jgi:chemotaxis protein methyltransferase CheR
MIDELQTDGPELKPREFAQICALAQERFGLNLQPGKERLVSSRLAKHLRVGGFRSFAQYLDHVTTDRSGESLIALIDALTTNHTNFLREQQHFEFLRSVVLPKFEPRASLDVWCAASSTGEEPYTIAFSVLEAWANRRISNFQILATDISTRVLEAAGKGVYAEERLKPLPPDWIPKYFLRGEGTSKGLFRVKPGVREHVQFKRLNLMEPFPHTKLFQIIFCRNVMIYFDQRTQADVVNRMAEALEPGGYLFVGHAESLTGINHSLEYVRPATYRKPESGYRAVSSKRGKS